MLKLQTLLGVDRAIGFSIATRIIQAIGSLLSVFFIMLTLDVNEQGFYYTFGSIIGIQLFFELGITSNIVQFVAHETALLSWNTEFDLRGDAKHLSRLSSVLHLCIKYFSIGAFFLCFALSLGGYWFFANYNIYESVVSWKYPFLLLTISTSILFIIYPILSFIEGLGKINAIAQIRFYQQTIYLSSLIIVLMVGGKLWAMGIASALTCSFLIIYLYLSPYRKILVDIYKSIGDMRINYKEEILPFQWRIALSWVSGYLIFQLFNPVLFATEGPKIAGQMGATLVAINGISSVSMSWINTKIAIFSNLIATNSIKQLDIIFNKAIRQSLLVNSVLTLVFLIFLIILVDFVPDLANRFLDFRYVVILSITSFFNQLIFSWAAYLRSHKQEPFLLNSIVTGILISFSVLITANYYGISALITSYSAISLAVALPWSYYIYKLKKEQWYG